MRSNRTLRTGLATLLLVLPLAAACEAPTGPAEQAERPDQDNDAPVALDVSGSTDTLFAEN